MRLVPVAALSLAVFAVLVGSAPAAGTAPVKLRLVVSSKAPVVESKWRWTVTATQGGKRVRGTVKLNIVLGTAVVGCWKRGKPLQCASLKGSDALSFYGRRTGIVRWPAEAQGVTLVFQAIVKAKGKRQRFRVPLVIQPAPAVETPPATTSG